MTGTLQGEVLISAAQVLVGPAGERIPGGAVFVRDGKIAGVGPSGSLEPTVPAETRLLRFPASTVLPGLIDCHVHLAFDCSADVVAALRVTSDDLLAAMTARARRLLDAGVTTARDLGDRGVWWSGSGS